mgnify:CR=1 FL=1
MESMSEGDPGIGAATLGLVLAGGLARRMGGGDKPLRMLGGRTILARVVERLAPQCDGVLLNANGDAGRFGALGLPVEFADERLSSAEAKRILREQGLTERKMRGKVDMLAASLFLPAWLDSRNGGDVRGQA